MRSTGTYVTTTTLGEPVRAFVPHPLPPAKPALAPESYEALTRAAELALARLSGVSGLVPSVEWLLYSAIRKEALLTSQIEGTQATLTDLFDDEAGLAVANTDDVEEVTNYLRAFRLVRDGFHALTVTPRGTLIGAVPGAIVTLAPGQSEFVIGHRISRGTRPLHVTATPDGHTFFGEYFSNETPLPS